MTTILVTHDQEEALSVADRVAVMRSGRLEQVAPPSELYSRPATAFVAEFVGVMNRIQAVMGTDNLVHVLLGHDGDQRLPVDGEHPSANTPVWVLTRPESVHVSPAVDDQGSLVQVATFLGAVTRVTLTLPDGTDIKADVPSHEAGRFPIGSYATVRLAERPVLVVPR